MKELNIGSADFLEIEGLRTPEEFYWVINGSHPLAGMQLPRDDFPYPSLYEHGFRWVACLCSEQPRYDPHPLQSLVNVELCDLYEKELPEECQMEEKGIGIIADLILDKLTLGEGVVVHCAGGRGRTGTVIGCVLKRLGFATAEIVSQLDRLHKTRGKSGWPESPWQKEVVARSQQTEP